MKTKISLQRKKHNYFIKRSAKNPFSITYSNQHFCVKYYFLFEHRFMSLSENKFSKSSIVP